MDSQRNIGEYWRVFFKFLWDGNQEKYVLPWVKWDLLASPKILGRWGLKIIFMFSEDLAAKTS
jgi:hypothetical protein